MPPVRGKYKKLTQQIENILIYLEKWNVVFSVIAMNKKEAHFLCPFDKFSCMDKWTLDTTHYKMKRRKWEQLYELKLFTEQECSDK